MTLMAPFLIGLAGSIHCIGMCGPLAGLVARSGKNSFPRVLSYNIGRIFTYGILGAIISFAGSIASLFGVQVWVSVSVGIILIAVGFTRMRIKPPGFVSRPLSAMVAALQGKLGSRFGPVVMGMINGLLPCGMTWIALAYCITLQWPLDGFISMILFGLGTVPAMIGFSTLITKLTTRFHISFRSVQTVLLVLSGCILIVRTFGAPDVMQSGEITTCGTQTSILK